MSLASAVHVGRSRNHPVLGYAISVAAVGLATLFTYLLPPLHEAPTDLYFAAIAAVAWCCGKGPAILAIGLSTLAVDYFIIPPVFSILLDIADLTRFAIFAFVALLICYLQDKYQQMTIRLRDANDVLEARVQERTATLAVANESLLREIQERKGAAAALFESEAKLRVALGGMESSLKEKEILLREINHRVKNNLQIISSLLSLQGSQIKDQASREIFKECQHRVRAIALVHQRLCRSPSLTNVDLAGYVGELVRELYRSYSSGPATVTPKVLVDDMSLNIDHLIPCALIVNELVCNSLKYAFPQGGSGEVRIEIHRRNGQVNLSVADDGIGFSPNGAPRQNGIGLAIVQALVEQINGKLQWADGRGTCATVTFSETN